MVLKDLIAMCDNIKPETTVIIYDSLTDYMNNTPLWNEYEASQLAFSTIKIAKFEICPTLVAVAMAT